MKSDLLIAAVAGLGITAAIGIAHEIGWSRAEKASVAIINSHVDRVNAHHAEELAKANQRERATERELTDQLAAKATQYRKGIEDEKQKRERFVAGVRDGSIRLSIPVRAGGHCAAPAGADTATGPGPGDEARAEIAPEAGLALTAIADAGDDAIRQLNSVIDAYETVRARYNALDNAQTR